MAEHTYPGCSIPPEIYAAGMGWDPEPEVQRLLFLAHEAGVEVRAALELGCGAGRLLTPMAKRVERVVGVELSPDMAAAARAAVEAAGASDRAAVVAADMCELALGERFDLIYTSPNTLRHVLTEDAMARLWRGVRDHLLPGGVFIADLELGLEHERRAVGRPQCWALEHDGSRVEVRWEVMHPPAGTPPQSRVRWTFVHRSGSDVRRWWEEFDLRVFEIEELLAAALPNGLTPVGVYENRDPYLLPREPRGLVGRFVIVLRART